MLPSNLNLFAKKHLCISPKHFVDYGVHFTMLLLQHASNCWKNRHQKQVIISLAWCLFSRRYFHWWFTEKNMLLNNTLWWVVKSTL